MIVPVSVPANKPYELTRSSLEEMWKMYADKLEGTGLKVKQNIVLTKGKRGGSILNPNFQYLCT
jgi:hypothetical protein